MQVIITENSKLRVKFFACYTHKALKRISTKHITPSSPKCDMCYVYMVVAGGSSFKRSYSRRFGLLLRGKREERTRSTGRFAKAKSSTLSSGASATTVWAPMAACADFWDPTMGCWSIGCIAASPPWRYRTTELGRLQ